MDFENIKKLKVYYDQIRKFRKLDLFSKMSKDEFHDKMKQIFPDFEKENKSMFKSITSEKDLHILDFMFQKLNDTEIECIKRKDEIKIVEPFARCAEQFMADKIGKKTTKSKLLVHFLKFKDMMPISNEEFVEKYPKIIERFLDDDFKSYDPEVLLHEQIRFKYEVQVGEVMAKQYFPNQK